MEIPRDLIELFSEFAAGGVRYLLVGGHAVGAHGKPRSTKDVDLWLDPAPDNIARAAAALARFGLPQELVGALANAAPSEIVWFGRAPTRVDLLQTLPGVEFASAWPRRMTLQFETVVVEVIGKEDLIVNKLAVGRPQDRRDVRLLQAPSKAADPPGAPTRTPTRAPTRSLGTRSRRKAKP
jgi:hypothetical protein